MTSHPTVYAVTDLGLSRNLVLGAIALGAAVELITIPLFRKSL